MTIITAAGAESLVNTSTAQSQFQPQTTALANGQYVVIWVDHLLIGAFNNANTVNADVKGRIFNADGTPAGAEFMVNGLSTGRQLYPTVTTLADGNFLVAWQEELGAVLGGGGSQASIKAREFTAAGAPVGGEFLIGPAGGDLVLPGITSLADGGFMASYHVGGIGGQARLQRFDTNNTATGAEIIVSTVAGTLGYAGIKTLIDGNIVAVLNTASGSPSPFIARVYTPAGVQIGNDMPVGFPAQIGVLTGLTALTSGGFAVSYMTLNGSTIQLNVDGFLAETLTDHVVLGTYSVAAVDPFTVSAALSPLANGGVGVLWTDFGAGDGNGSGIRLSAFNAIGNEIGTSQLVNTNTSGSQISPRLVTLTNGDLVAVWSDPSGTLGDASGLSIKQRAFDVNYANQIPIARPDVFVIAEASGTGDSEGLLDNDTELDGDALIITSISNVQGGTATIDVLSQIITFNRTGTALTFDYTVDDGFGGTATSHATVVATRDDTVTLRGGGALIDFLANDYLSPRPEGYSYVFSPSQSPNGLFYGTTPVNGADQMFGSTVYFFSGTGYGFLPVGQTLTETITYSVLNPTTGFADYNATVTVTLQGWTQTGGTGYDELYGGATADHLIGGTGAANALIGGAGDDWYTVQASGDSVIETAGAGTDSVYTPLGVLVLAANVENLSFIGTSSLARLGVGNAENNRIVGLNARDELFGGAGNDDLRGGAGGDGMENTMFGGTGDDVFVVSVRGDSTIELVGQGNDTVKTTFTVYGLQANIENLTFTDSGTHGAGVGNVLDNVLTGGTGVDNLFGREGNDTLIGGSGSANTLLGQEGDDIYVVTASGDSVIEFAGQGTDTVQTNLASFVLRPDVENLTYTGTGNFTGIGAADANVITGGAGNDFLAGRDGNDTITGAGGNDEMFGDAGADTFRFQGGDGIDRIYDFTPGTDKIGFISTVFTVTGTLALVQGSAPAATSANTTILYNSTTGLLSYDLDGNGAGGAAPLANLNAGLTLTLGDFVFY